jgi:flagellar biosynthesis protein FliR
VVGMKLPPTPTTLIGVTALLAGEVVLGLLIGGAVRLLLSALHLAGNIIGMQSGLAAATVFDPSQGGQAVIVSRFLTLIAIVMIFATDTHHLLIAGMSKSYALFPVGGGLMPADFAKYSTEVVAKSFMIGVQLSAPFLLFGVIFNVGLGLMSRLAPTLQVFFIAQPLSILGSVALLLAVLGAMMTWFIAQFQELLKPLLGLG